MKAEAKNYTLSIDDNGVIDVFVKEPPQVRSTEICASGVRQIAPPPELQTIVTRMATQYPEVRAANHDGKEFFADLNVGLQRWKGQLSALDIAKGLRQMGFKPKTVREVMAKAKEHKADSLTRVAW